MASLVNKNGFQNFAPSTVHGPIYSQDYDSDGSLWLPAPGGAGGIFTFVGTFTSARNALGDYTLNLTAAANSPFVVVDLSQIFDKIGSDPIAVASHMSPAFTGTFNVPPATGNPLGATGGGTAPASGVGPIKIHDNYEFHIIRGIMLTGYDVVFNLGTANLTTHTGTCVRASYDTTHAPGTVVTTTTDAAQPLGVTTNANNQIASVNIATPFVLGNNASVKGTTVISDYLEIAIVNPGTSVYKLYGIRLYFDYCLH